LSERQIAELIENDEVHSRELIGDPTLPSVTGLDLEPVDEIDHVVEAAAILLGHDFWIFHLPKLPRYGFWSMMHEARADFCMLLGSIYLLLEGGGAWSLGALWFTSGSSGDN
jgi:hypothetical protein